MELCEMGLVCALLGPRGGLALEASALVSDGGDDGKPHVHDGIRGDSKRQL